MSTRFERDTAIERTAAGIYTARVDRAWWVQRGPNGGYLAAIILRALRAEVDDDTRAPRAITVHFVSPPDEGEIAVHTTIERVGRSLTSVSARTFQASRLLALAVGAFSKPRAAPGFCDLVMPVVAPASAIEHRQPPAEAPEIARRWDCRWGIGQPPFEGRTSHEAVAGGWIRLEEPQPLDAVAMVAVADAWVPPLFSRTDEMLAVPTVDLTVHFRSELPHSGMAADEHALAVFRTTVAAEGFLEEDGEVWAPDGTLLAQSRQLAAIMPMAG
jgi:acyl-CoA thioesterase